MEIFADYLAHIDSLQNRYLTESILNWVAEEFTELQPKIAWNQPMFTHHDTFIIGFSVAKHHLAIAPERAGIIRFTDEIIKAGYEHTKELIRMKWDCPIDLVLLEKIIEFNILDKAECTNFWRK